MDNFKLLSRAGVGAHGLVFKALDLRTKQLVALKQIEINTNFGLPHNTLREICVLKQLKSKHTVQLKEVLTVNSAVLLVMEYLQCSLADILRYVDRPLRLSQIKTYMKMILIGVKDMHSNHIMHRDLKPANLLISDKGVLKIADFGLSRIYSKDEDRLYTHQVATRWYRAPEILYGSRKYSPAIDMWAVGCILAEMINNQPLFAGDTDIKQLAIVLATLGTPNEETWPGLTELPDYNKISFTESKGMSWESIISSSDSITLDLLKNILQYNYNKRPSASEALIHPFFFEKPLPCELNKMPNFETLKKENSWHLKDFDEIVNLKNINLKE